jgi:hypothetical protein
MSKPIISKFSSLIILDWDDTLFPTAWAIQNNINVLNEISYLDKFHVLDIVLSNLLNNLLDLGKVIIITNALPEWVNLSSKLLPNTRLVLKNIKVVSARQKYNKKIANVMDWKKLAFIEENALKYNNVISVGDAQYEYQALININKFNKNIFLKSIRFIPSKSFDIIVDQIETLNNSIYNLWNLQQHLDLTFKHRH